MVRVVLIGSGNLAIHLAKGMHASSGVELVQYYSRSDKDHSYFPASLPRTDDLNDLAEADIYVIAVKDDVIREVGSGLQDCKGLVVHTAGTISMEALAGCSRRGVFYPVQTFSRDRSISWSTTPLALETASPEDMYLLKEFAANFSENVYEINSEARKKLHLAAVFANNFSNHMYTLSKEVCLKNGLPFDLVKPLILETARKVMVLEPEEAQTGPARRKDQVVMNEQKSHLDQEKKEIYSLLSRSIGQRYGSQRKNT